MFTKKIRGTDYAAFVLIKISIDIKIYLYVVLLFLQSNVGINLSYYMPNQLVSKFVLWIPDWYYYVIIDENKPGNWKNLSTKAPKFLKLNQLCIVKSTRD